MTDILVPANYFRKQAKYNTAETARALKNIPVVQTVARGKGVSKLYSKAVIDEMLAKLLAKRGVPQPKPAEVSVGETAHYKHLLNLITQLTTVMREQHTELLAKMTEQNRVLFLQIERLNNELGVKA